ncbi:SDR family oxidoreductase [Streptoalloteichus tenebrarius]|uniref:SDR family oxidoreductase n=1 Tax=Streptoalloteichus tenebrarius (strain ATCC 17920 / DSM 40477 / JCM 4838 / CBS 697.72 / NBRC 16177 / NCIMB 11028 / NRRL B-12390 / A12253. 1 / ISP 5477) TaxID=1933 RepID=UPI0020A3D2C6|nr:SDR family oxidoreductase [Streptoalloteichus tenebrarius]
MSGSVAVVTGATRGCGRAISVELGRQGATVYVTGRTTRERRSEMNRPETIEGTAELVDAAGGTGVPVRVDFTTVSDVDALVSRIEREQGGRLDILVDDVWGGDPWVEWGRTYWEGDLDKALRLVHNGLDSHLIALHRLLPLMVRRRSGLVVEVTDGDTDRYSGALPYYLVKSGIRRIGHALGHELRPRGVTAVTVTPGFLRSEAVLDHFGVTEQTWREAIAKDEHFALSETPYYLARGIAAMATDPRLLRWSGRTTSSWELMREYGFTDVDGSQPDWGAYSEAAFRRAVDVDPENYR